MEFHQLNSGMWNDPGEAPLDTKIRRIWPTGPIFTDEGAGIIRFLTAADCSTVSVSIKNIETHETSGDSEICQFSIGERIETIMRIPFPKDGKYLVTVFTGKETGIRFSTSEVIYESLQWRFDVRGAPSPPRSLCVLISGRKWRRLSYEGPLQVEPNDECVKIPDLVYHFSCKFRGNKLLINGQNSQGDPEQVLFPETENIGMEGDWQIVRCTLTFPMSAVWLIIFWLDEKEITIQRVVAGMTRPKLTMDEKFAFMAN
jgi:hypothetical protein